jgi:uncharacterized protein YaaW (UPF0174 family)
MSKYEPLLAHPADLPTVLQVADADDLSLLANFITDNGEGRLSLDSAVAKKLTACSKHQVFSQADRSLIAQEILLFGGNTVANLYRSIFSSSSTISYQELVQDLAKKVGAQVVEGADLQVLEQAILLRIFTQALDKMTEADRKKVLDELGIASTEALRSLGWGAATGTVIGSAVGATITLVQLNIAAIVAAAISTQMLGRVAGSAIAFLSTRSATALAGPVGLAVGALWSLADLSSPAYRVTLPCVVQVAYMRKKYLAELLSNKCPSCEAENVHSAKFCNECGKSLATA